MKFTDFVWTTPREVSSTNFWKKEMPRYRNRAEESCELIGLVKKVSNATYNHGRDYQTSKKEKEPRIHRKYQSDNDYQEYPSHRKSFL